MHTKKRALDLAPLGMEGLGGLYTQTFCLRFMVSPMSFLNFILPAGNSRKTAHPPLLFRRKGIHHRRDQTIGILCTYCHILCSRLTLQTFQLFFTSNHSLNLLCFSSSIEAILTIKALSGFSFLNRNIVFNAT